MATDYAACREMLRTKEQLLNEEFKSSSYGLTYRLIQQGTEETIAKTACEKRYLAAGNPPSAEESGLIAQCVNKFRDQRKQYWDSAILEHKLNTKKSQQKLDKVLAKIKHDMRKADCPYE